MVHLAYTNKLNFKEHEIDKVRVSTPHPHRALGGRSHAITTITQSRLMFSLLPHPSQFTSLKQSTDRPELF
jgi:hypothetical protein